ncbi:MAG: hypothetical protein SFX18_07090 [Pirellulales bacterium]|nr:hypothetical protein [Pirellulales bacterium]
MTIVTTQEYLPSFRLDYHVAELAKVPILITPKDFGILANSATDFKA